MRPKPKSELKLLVKEENREVLEKIAAIMSNSSLTSALNFVLETQGETVLEQLEAMKSKKSPSASILQSNSAPQTFIPERQSSIPELDGDAVGSAFD